MAPTAVVRNLLGRFDHGEAVSSAPADKLEAYHFFTSISEVEALDPLASAFNACSQCCRHFTLCECNSETSLTR